MKIHLTFAKGRYCQVNYNSLFFIFVLCFLNIFCGFSQIIGNQGKIYFISDVQSPLPVEKIHLKGYRNEEARNKLFEDLLLLHPDNLFILGDLVSRGSDGKAWADLDTFLNSLSRENTHLYVIPGNHDYRGRLSGGIQMYKYHFHEKWLYGNSVKIDSIAIVLLNSNFNKLSENELSKQLKWYKAEMNSLDSDPSIKGIIVCTHHAPYSNSKAVGSSELVQKLIIPDFEKSRKSILFISGHSHNLEYFSDSNNKHFLVIGGGGGLTQPLLPVSKRKYHDLLRQDSKPVYFYLVIEKEGNNLKLMARGFKNDFNFFEFIIGILHVE